MREPAARADVSTVDLAASTLVSLALAALMLSAVPAAGAGSPAPAMAAEERDERPPALRGLSLEDALERLRADGLELVYSSALVRPGMRVTREPTADHPRRVLAQLLEPHGLRAIAGESGALVVVARRGTAAAAAPAPSAGVLRGQVRSVFDGAPVAGALLRLTAVGSQAPSPGSAPPPALTSADGRFLLSGLPAGVYSVRVHHPGFDPASRNEVAVSADQPRSLDFELQPRPYLHDEIVVAASRATLLHAEPAGPLSLSRTEVEALPHLGADVFRALTLLPGTAANDTTAQLAIRGGRRDEVAVLLDGQELYQPFHLRDFDDGLSVVTADTLDGVTLTAGALGARYGDRMGGVLDLTTRSPNERTTRLRLSVLNAQLSTGGSLGGDRGSWLAAARRGSIELASRVFGQEDPSFWDAFGKLESAAGPRQRLRLQGLRAADALDFSDTDGDERKRFDTEYDGAHLWLVHDLFLGERTVVETRIARSDFDRDRRGFESEEEQTWDVVDRRATEVLAVESRWSWEASPSIATEWGAAARRFETAYDYTSTAEAAILPESPEFEPRAALRRFVGTARNDHFDAWVSHRFSPTPGLTLMLGGRYDRHTLTDEHLWSPRLNLAWRPHESGVWRLGWGRHHQSQRSYELGIADGETAFARAERADHLVLGWERLLSEDPSAPLRALRLEAYGRWIDDPRDRFQNLYEPINTFPEIEPDRVRVRASEARARGLETTLRGALGERASWWLAYSLSAAEDRVAGRWVPRPLDQTHALTLFVGTRLGTHWRLDLAWRYHTGWPTTPIRAVPGLGDTVDPEDEEGGDDGEANPPSLAVGRLHSERLSDYHRLDSRLSREWELARSRLRFFVDVQNVYDRKNIGGYDLEIDEDSGALERVAERWTGFFPSVGIVWEF